MIAGKRVLALIPARSGSKGLPGKNVRPFLGRPLLAWPIEAARGSTHVDAVVVSTDDPEMAEIARSHGAEAPFLRPTELASDTAPSIGFILHALDFLAGRGDHFDYLVLLEPTSPLTASADVDAALEHLVREAELADAVVGVSALEAHHPAFAVKVTPNGLLAPFQGAKFADLPRRQDVEPLYSLDGSLYVSTVEALRRERGFCHDRTLPHVMPKHKALEVDDMVDFICLEAIATHYELARTSQES